MKYPPPPVMDAIIRETDLTESQCARVQGYIYQWLRDWNLQYDDTGFDGFTNGVLQDLYENLRNPKQKLYEDKDGGPILPDVFGNE